MSLKGRLVDSAADFTPAEREVIRVLLANYPVVGFIGMQQTLLAELGAHPGETKPASAKKAKAKSS